MITDYDYEEYFYTGAHHKNLLFVEQSANVTKVSGMPPKITMPSGAGPAVTITNENMIEEQFELVESLNSAENWAWGSVEPSMVTFDIREDGRVPIIEDHIFRLYLYFDGDSDTLMYVGSYVFDQDKLSDDAKTRTVSGFDFMQGIRDTDIIDFYRGLFNAHEEPDPEDPEHTIWVPGREKITVLEARNKLFEYLDEEEGFPIIQETVELPNDTFEFAFDVDTEALSAGQFLEDICEINGRYGHFGRQLSTAQATKNYQIFQYIRVERYDEDGTRIANDMRIEGISKGLYETKSIGRLRVYNRDSVRIAYYDEGYKKSYSKYNIYDNILIDDLTKSKTTTAALKTMLQNIYDSIRYRKYVPFTAKTPADLCREVGDRITLWTDLEINTEEGLTKKFKTLIFERKITGIQNMVDTYSAKGDKKLPEFGDYTSSGGYSASTSGKKAKKGDKEKTKSDGKFELEDCTTADFVEYLRNIGIRLLDEPSDVSVEYIPDSENRRVELKWSDPPDITDYKPMPCEWEGTVIVRSEGKPAKQRWGGTKIDAFHTRDEHKTTAFADTSIEIDKEYYYSIMPYYVYMDDDDHPRRHYTFTCIYKVTTYAPMPKPVINSITVDGTDVTINYTIEAWSGGSYTQCKVVAKKKKIPQDISDGKTKNVSIGTDNTVTMTGLDELTDYYFVIFCTDGNKTVSSDPVNKKTGRDNGVDFSYTGEIQTFTAPKTGIYSLETWGAQGGDATDGTNTARGGYGAYAYGEVFLQQGDTLFVNVGGQNGYGGGGTEPVGPNPPQEYAEKCEAIGSYMTRNGSFDETDEYQGRSGYYSGGSSSAIGSLSFPISLVSTDNYGFSETYSYQQIYSVFMLGIGTIKLTESSGSVTAVYEGFETINPFTYNGSAYGSAYALYDSPRWGFRNPASGSFPSNITTTFSSLSDAIDYIYIHFRNVSIYVDGECWALAETEA